MSAKKASSSMVGGLSTTASSAIAAVKGYTAISTTLRSLASVNSSAAGSTFTATQGYLRVVGGGTKKASTGTIASSAVAPAQVSVKVAASGSALASAGTVTSSAVTASQGSASTVVAAGSASAGTAASSAIAATQGSAAVGATGSALVSAGTVANHVLPEPQAQGYVALAIAAGALTLAGVAITSAFATDQDSAAAATSGNTSASAGAATTSSVAAAKGSTVAAAKEDNTEAVTGRNAIDSVSTMTGLAISVAQGTPAYIAATKRKPSAGYVSTSAFLQSAAAKGISASTKIILLVPEKVALGAGVAVAGAIVDLQAAGFTVDGIAAGSPAAAVQSIIGDVAKGSIFAMLQSKGMLGEAIAVIL